MSGRNGLPPVFIHQGRTIVSLPGMHEMAEKICRILRAEHVNRMEHVKVEHETFANDESKPIIGETLRGEQVFLLAPLQHPHPDIAFMRMLRTAQAIHLASAEEITLVAPYFSFARQDRKAKPREPITARLNADMIEVIPSITRMITSELHAPQIQGFFKIPVDDISCMPIQVDHLRAHYGKDLGNVTVVAPDLGSGKRTEQMAAALNVPIAIIDKRRQKNGEAESFAVIGDIKGRDCIIVDDMVDGGGTMRNARRDLMKAGAKSVLMVVTHAILSGDSVEKFRAEEAKLIATQTIPRPAKWRKENESWLSFVEIEPLLAGAMHQASIVGGSISQLSKAHAA